MIAPDHATFDFVNYMNRMESEDTHEDDTVRDTDGWPMIPGETYWDAEGSYVPTEVNSMNRYLDNEVEDYGRPIDFDYDNLAEILQEFKGAEVISWT